MNNHLKDAKTYARQAGSDLSATGRFDAKAYAQLAIAHALIALVERMDKAADDADIAAERADLICERLAQRRASERIL